MNSSSSETADAIPSQSVATDIAGLKRKAGWSAILLGGLGVHKFLLGYKRAGTIMLAAGLIGWIFFALPSLIVMVIGIIEGIIYLCKSDADFAATYVQGRREWF
jgi:TM2 domain-containing membrane protein YozV